MDQKMLDRIERIKKRVCVDRYPICIERYKIAVDVMAESKNDPVVIRRAKTLKAYVERMPIEIADDELIVGIGSSKHMGIEIDPDFGLWPQNEIDALKEDGFLIDPQDEVDLQILNEKFNPPNFTENIADLTFNNDRLLRMKRAGLPFPPWRDRKKGDTPMGGGYAQSGLGLGPSLILCCVDYTMLINEGAESMIERCREKLSEVRFDGDPNAAKRQRFYRAAIMSLEAACTLGKRYSELAAKMAAEEKDPERKKELELISETCARVPAKPARTFREALQCFWFQFLLLSPSTTLPGGRFDQYMNPFYEADIAAGRITRDEALELLCLLRLKDMELNRTSGVQNRKKNSGMAKWHNFIIGGVKPDGTDATNEVSYLLLEAAATTKTPHHTLTVRVYEGTPDKLMLEALKVVRMGLGMPAFMGDKSYMNTFMSHGVPIEDARDYVVAGCMDGNIPGRSRVGPVPMVAIPIMFDIFRHQGIDRNTGTMSGIDCGKFTEFKSFDELYEAFLKEMHYFVELAAEDGNIMLHVLPEITPDPLRSVLMRGGIDVGLDLFDRKMLFENGAVINPIGMVNAADSLTAIKKLVFEDKKYTLQELEDALENDWEGREEMRKDFAAAPKYGNNDDYADSMIADIYAKFYAMVLENKTPLGGVQIPTGISITTHQPTGALTGATPDGRHAGDILADGCVSPMHGMDTCGVTSVFQSALRINQDPAMAELFNVKFHPSALKTDEDLMKLAALIKVYMCNGGKHVQFNVVDKETLRAAQNEPDKYRDLVVRIAGYSAYFLQLSKPMQEEVIARNEHTL